MSYSISAAQTETISPSAYPRRGRQEARGIGKKTENVTLAAHLCEINEEVYKTAVPLHEHLEEQRRAMDRNTAERKSKKEIKRKE